MNVVTRADPVIERMVGALSGGGARRAGVVVGAPGMGKTAVLAACAVELRSVLDAAQIVWISGAVVAGESHLATLIASKTDAPAGWTPTLPVVCERLATWTAGTTILVVDDLDDLVFKRQQIGTQIAGAVVRCENVILLGSCRPEARDRLLDRRCAFAAQLNSRLFSESLDLLDAEQAEILIRRRVPGLDEHGISAVVGAAGGHPAALVFLSRLAELRNRPAGGPMSELLDRAAEFAGAVYAEAWATLGPQQRAILWHLARAEAPVAAVEISPALALPVSQISAQLTRLVLSGLLSPASQRGRYTVAPLLARWIERRATRDAARLSDMTQRRVNHTSERLAN